MESKMTMVGYFIFLYLLEGSYSKALPTQYTDPLVSVQCDFENGLCPGYEVDTTSQLQWFLQQGPTSSRHTGPSYDKTLGKGQNGWYVYIESSNQLSGRIARMKTGTLDHAKTSGEKLCLTFHYHMYGHTMGNFSVYIAVPGDGREEKYFHLKGNQKQKEWQLGRFEFDTPSKPFKIVFEGTTSFSYFGDIALDQIDIKQIAQGETCDFWPTKASTKPKPTQNPSLIPAVPFVKSRTVSGTGVNPPCGRRRIKMGRIFGGNIVTPIGKWPWMTMLQRKKADNTFEHNCGGTLFGVNWVITAAHCVETVEANNHLRVRLGAHRREALDVNTQQIGIKGIYVHPDYKKVTKFNNDIALLELERPAMLNNYVESVCLPRDPIKAGTKCVIAGWGKLWKSDEFPATYSDLLVEADIQTKTHNECRQQYNDKVTTNMLCAGQYNNHADTCEGDSGGPLMCENSDGSWSLTGITSWGHQVGCGNDYYGVYTKVTEVMQWIKNTVANPQSATKMH